MHVILFVNSKTEEWLAQRLSWEHPGGKETRYELKPIETERVEAKVEVKAASIIVIRTTGVLRVLVVYSSFRSFEVCVRGYELYK